MTKLNAFSFSINSETKERKGVGTRSPHSLQLAARSLGRHATNSQTGLEKRRPPPPDTQEPLVALFWCYLSIAFSVIDLG